MSDRITPFEQETAEDGVPDSRIQSDAFDDAIEVGVDSSDIPSNEKLLGTAFVSFMSFSLTQLVFAVIAGSEAMMGDSAAMIVDALTYLFNWIAERRKNGFDRMHANNGPGMDPRKRARSKRKMVLQLEIIPPLISVSTLVIVTIVVTKKAVGVLYRDFRGGDQKTPNVNLMLAFSILNLFLDGMNVYCFARAKHLMGYAITDNNNEVQSHSQHSMSNNSSIRSIVSSSSRYEHVVPDVENERKEYNDRKQTERPRNTEPVGSFDSAESGTHDEEHTQANLNMCSAYTHVFADTLRSVAVIIAACSAELLPRVTPEEADAAAAVVVSFLILLSLVPLIQGLIKSVAELRAILGEEQAEVMFSEYRADRLEQQMT